MKIQLWTSGNVTINAVGPGVGNCVIAQIQIVAPAALAPVATIAVASAGNVAVTIPAAFITAGAGPAQLMGWAAIQAVINASGAARAELEAARDALLTGLASLELQPQVPGGFFGIQSLPAGPAAVTAGSMWIDLRLLGTNPAPLPDAVILRTAMTTSGVINAQNLTIEVEVAISLIAPPTVSVLAVVETAAGPLLQLHWPAKPFPGLTLPGFAIGVPANILDFHLPLPTLAAPTLRVTWTAGAVTLAVTAAGVLTITSTMMAGALVCKTGGVAIATIIGFSFAFTGAALALTGAVAAAAAPVPITVPGVLVDLPSLPFSFDFDDIAVTFVPAGMLTFEPPALGLTLTAMIRFPRVTIEARTDPSLTLVLTASYQHSFPAAAASGAGGLTALAIIDPAPRTLVAAAGCKVVAAAGALLPVGGAVAMDAPVLGRIADMAAAAVLWLQPDAGGALLAVARAARQALANFVHALSDVPAAGQMLTIELGLDPRSYGLRRIVVAAAQTKPGAALVGQAAGFDWSVSAAWTPALLIDLSDSRQVALLAQPASGAKATLGTDLWLDQDHTITAARDTDGNGASSATRLIQLFAMAKSAPAAALSLVRFGADGVHFFEQVSGFGGQTIGTAPLGSLTVVQLADTLRFAAFDAAASGVSLTASVNPDAAQRVLPFLQSTGSASATPSGSGSLLDTLQQYITIDVAQVPVPITTSAVTVPITASLRICGTTTGFQLSLNLSLASLRVQLQSNGPVRISGPSNAPLLWLGLNATITAKTGPTSGPIPWFLLDFSSGDAILSLDPTSRLVLTYGQLSSAGEGIKFVADTLSISRGGLDLDAEVDADTPVTLAGLDMPFRFARGTLSIKQSRIQAFSIAGAGQLPPELIGEANASIAISLAQNSNGTLIVQGASASLDCPGAPIVCHATRFTFTLSHLGLEFKDFTDQNAGYHFYFTLTGTASFQPLPGEFGDGLLKNFGGISITLDNAPLARDPSKLEAAVEFQIAVVPKKTFNMFDLFSFELRGIGFRPRSPAFNGLPAMSISGQVNFIEAGDMVSPRFDFHEMWIAPPKQGEVLPQIRFDGLTVGIRFGSSASISGTAVTVDDTLPSLYRPGVLPANVTSRGFLASGTLSITGWGSMSAAMGFLQITAPGGRPRLAFFMYLQQNELSIEIPTPVGPIYLREVGFGLGFRFTIAAFNRADQVKSLPDLVQVLDDVSRYQGNLASLQAWEPQVIGDDLTLALRGLLSIESASGETEYNATAEKELANPLLFDIVAAMRSDLTFFMAVRAWLCRNYADWHDAGTSDAWRSNPTLTGYMYLSVPRREMLARMVYPGTGDLDGMHPQLPAPLIEGMRSVKWSATTLIRPGLFHQEFGWPYELSFKFAPNDQFQIQCNGGLINRIEDGAMLYGIAFKAVGFAALGGEVGSRSFGASVTARADFTIDAKMIAYLSVKRFSDTLFYGALNFALSIRFAVNAWLNFEIGSGMFKISVHLGISFAMTLTVTLALEVAVTPQSIGGRGTATVGISAFGRSLRLGVSFGFNEDLVASARDRCARFLTLGVGVALPDPASAVAGVGAPPSEAPRGPRAAAADRSVDDANAQRQLVKNNPLPPLPVPLPPQASLLRPSGYWAMLFPMQAGAAPAVAAGARRYVMIFVPRDHSEIDADTALPQNAVDSGKLGSFYPPASDTIGQTELSLINLTSPLTQLLPGGGTTNLVGRAPIPISYDRDAIVVTSDGGANTLTLANVMRQCFLGDSGTPAVEPGYRPVHAGSITLPSENEARAQALADAGLDHTTLPSDDAKANEIEERRSSIIAAFCESASRLATGAADLTQPAALSSLDIRSLGVTFIVTDRDIAQLFTVATGTPWPAKFDLTAPGVATQVAGSSVHLFNPPETMFEQNSPKLADPSLVLTKAGLQLDWDLEPAFRTSKAADLTLWNNPEFRLKHYRIDRIITAGGSLPVPRRATARAAAPIRFVRDARTGVFGWRFVRPAAQYVDDFADLDVATRQQLLAGQMPATIRYTVVPVDSAGTAGLPTPLQIVLKQNSSPRAPVLRAQLSFIYTKGIPDDVGPPDADGLVLRLGLDDGADAATPAVPPLRKYILRFRPENGQASGLYCGDASTDMQQRPTAADYVQSRPGDIDINITLTPFPPEKNPSLAVGIAVGVQPPNESQQYIVQSAGGLTDLLDAVGARASAQDRLKNGLRAVRCAIMPQLGTAWCPVDLTLRIDAPPSIKQPAMADMPIDAFEPVFNMDPAPLLGADLNGAAGRIMVWHPSGMGLLDEWLSTTSPPASQPILLADATRRVATQIKWNSRPVAFDKLAGIAAPRGAAGLAAFFGGFDLFEQDAADATEGADDNPTAVAIPYKIAGTTASVALKDGTMVLDQSDPASVSSLWLSLVDQTGADCSARLGRIASGGGIARLRVITAGGALTFAVTANIAARASRLLRVKCIAGSDKTLLTATSSVTLLYTQDPPARPIARVQAVSAALAALDPPAVSDFAKIAAQYPSEAARLSPPSTSGGPRLMPPRAGGRAAWYSPAESFAVWPSVIPRRSLAINVDESALIELLSSRTPTTIHMVATTIRVTLAMDPPPVTPPQTPISFGVQTVVSYPPLSAPLSQTEDGFKLTGSLDTKSLRRLLQGLFFIGDLAPGSPGSGTMTIDAMSARDAIATVTLPVDLAPALHPVLADVIDLARYAAMPVTSLFQLVMSGPAPALPPVVVGSTSLRFNLQSGAAAGRDAAPVLGFAVGSAFTPLGTEPVPVTSPATLPELTKFLLSTIDRLAMRLSRTPTAAMESAFAVDNGLATYLNGAQLLIEFSVLPGGPLAWPLDSDAMGAAGAPSRYRRYEPVLEPLPKRSATDLISLIDETPEVRDPYGWGVLRTFGLAAGLRLYDTEHRRYLVGIETVQQLSGAFQEVVARYADPAWPKWRDPGLDLGACFIDVITKPGGTMQLASFDGDPGESDSSRLLNDDALAMTQIALRPVPDRMSAEPDPLMRYFLITADAITKVKIDFTTLTSPVPFVVDILDLSVGLAKPPMVTLASTSPISHPSNPDEIASKKNYAALIDLLTEGGGIEYKFTSATSSPKSVPAVLLRVVYTSVSPVGGIGNLLQPYITDGVMSELIKPTQAGFGAFPPLSPARLSALAQTVIGPPPQMLVSLSSGTPNLPGNNFQQSLNNLQQYVERRWPGGWPSGDAQCELWARLQDWTSRFLDHGKCDHGPATNQLYYAIAEPTRPDIWRVGPDPLGVMSVIIPHDDRKRRLKRYAVRPFGRYQNQAEAWRRVSTGSPPRPPELGGSWSDGLINMPGVPADFIADWNQRFFDVVLPRSESIAPPLPIGASKKMINGKRVLEFLYERHPEEIRCEANLTVEAALAFEGVAFGLWRELAHQIWAADLAALSKTVIDTGIVFGSATPVAPLPLLRGDDGFGGLAWSGAAAAPTEGRLPDGWRGIMAMRTQAPPYFFRDHGVAYASAGAVVSTPVVSTIAEGHYDLALPWPLPPAAASAMPPPTPNPGWSWQPALSSQLAAVIFTLPLVRFADCMPDETRTDWLTESTLPALFALPDPVVRYDIGTRANDGAGGRSAVAAQLDIQAVQGNPGSTAKVASSYRANTAGPLFAGCTTTVQLVLDGYWRAIVTVQMPPMPFPMVASFAPQIIPPAGAEPAALLDSLAFDNVSFLAGGWSAIAPYRNLSITLPACPAGDPRVGVITHWVTDPAGAFAPYAGVAVVVKIVTAVNAWAGGGAGAATAQVIVSDVMYFAGLPPPAAWPTAVVVVGLASAYVWPAAPACGFAVRDKVRNLVPAAILAPADFYTVIGRPIRDDLRRLSALAKQLADQERFRLIQQLPPMAWADILAFAAATPDCADLLVTMAVPLAPAGPGVLSTRVAALINAIEAVPSTGIAIGELAVLEEAANAPPAGTRTALVHLPGRALTDPAVQAALTDFGVWGNARSVSLLLRRPPTDAERHLIFAALVGRPDLRGIVATAITAQIFGPGETPQIAAYRAIATPKSDVIQLTGWA